MQGRLIGVAGAAVAFVLLALIVRCSVVPGTLPAPRHSEVSVDAVTTDSPWTVPVPLGAREIAVSPADYRIAGEATVEHVYLTPLSHEQIAGYYAGFGAQLEGEQWIFEYDDVEPGADQTTRTWRRPEVVKGRDVFGWLVGIAMRRPREAVARSRPRPARPHTLRRLPREPRVRATVALS